MATVRIELNERSYNIFIENGILAQAGEKISGVCSGRSALLITELAIGRLYKKTVLDSLSNSGFRTSVAEIPGGEASKTIDMASSLYERLLDAHIDRNGIIVTLGGGVIGDLGGFVAATYLRGIDFLQIPTSLLAQVDASIGGKVGINLSRGKNLVGAFHQPRCVLIDPLVLATLPHREFVNGLAEIIKHGIISGQELFHFIRSKNDELKRLDKDTLVQVITRSCEIKAEIVSRDERDSGLRTVLNLGHTVGHALEAATGFARYSHGEAVAIGMVTAAVMSETMKLAEHGLADEIADVIANAGLPVVANEVCTEDIISATVYDKKVSSGKLRFVLPKKIGKVEIVDCVTENDVSQALDEQKRRFGRL